ncbi:putative thiol methyltransferase 2 [Leucoagaricus sp. SymC.cos]|nr:putative thiol methyltransferase 2 [Leucoagaricus sp. SymC.cos]
MQKIVNPNIQSTWDDAWKANLAPWDAGGIQPPLKEVIEANIDGIDWPTAGRALVPGCGMGHDALYLVAALGLRALGLEISQTVVDWANVIAAKNPPPKGKATFGVDDFFTFSPSEKFSLIYNYIFFVAIPPKHRNEWGRKMAELIKPGGFLLALVFPIDPYSDGSPPHYVRPEHYNEPLGHKFEKIVDRVPETSESGHVGCERLIVWKRNAN